VRDLVGKPLLVDGADLLQQNDRVPIESVRFGIDFHMGRQLRFLDLRGDRRNDDSWAESVPDIILNNENRPYAALFGPYDRRKVRKEYIATFDNQALHPAN